jgi:hypothetical protein
MTAATAARRVFGLDPRSLALLRIGLGMTLLLELVNLLPDVPAFFSDDGLLPRAACARLTADERTTFPPYWVSPYMLSGDAAWAYALFGLTAGFALALALGWKTRVAAVGAWALLVGLQARNPFVFYGSDNVMRCVLFWGLFLPLGSRWSLDARGKPAPAGPVVSLASAGLLIQLACLYLETGLVKSDPMWREDGSALYFALRTDLFTSPLGRALTDYPDLLRFLTAVTLGVEVVGPFLLFVPVGGWLVRTLAVAGFVGLHLGIAATMDIGLFPYTCMACWAGVLPGGLWDAILGRPALAPGPGAPGRADRLRGPRHGHPHPARGRHGGGRAARHAGAGGPPGPELVHVCPAAVQLHRLVRRSRDARRRHPGRRPGTGRPAAGRAAGQRGRPVAVDAVAADPHGVVRVRRLPEPAGPDRRLLPPAVGRRPPGPAARGR